MQCQGHSVCADHALLRSCHRQRYHLQAIEVSKHLVHFLLEHVSTTGNLPHGVNLPEPASGIKDAKVGGIADLRYHIIYGSHTVRGTPDGGIKVMGVKA